jgi:tetratricopeptide (TPR) repeat protein
MRGQLVAQRFRVGDQVGVGGMGVVHRAIDERTGEAVALKLVRADVTYAADRFGREIAALERLGGDGIVRYVASGLLDRTPYLVMEWLEGEDLAQRLRRARPTIAEVLTVARRTLDALARAHGAGVVHRDIKPANLFLPDCDVERLKIVDFGLALVETDDGFASSSGMFLGTPGYMAPEQARGERDVDGRADVFALGCVLYKCLTGRGPFVAADAVATIARVLFDEPRHPAEHPGVPAPLGDVVMRMLRKERAERPTAAELADELARLGTEPTVEQARPAAPVLTDREQRVVSVVVAAHGDVGDAEATVQHAQIPEVAAREAELQELAERLGARVEVVPGGVVASLFGRGAATDQAARAARLALALHDFWPDVTIAVATGRAEVGHRIVGEVIERAARDASRREAGVWLDDVTAGLLPPEFAVAEDSDGAKLLAEVRPSLPLFGLPPTRTLLGKPTPCVGRDHELGVLDAAFDASATEPAARAVLVVGDAGIGKSRLRHEWLRRLEQRARPPRVLLSRADSVTASAPFFLAAQLVRQAAGLHPQGSTPQALAASVGGVVEPSAATRVAQFLGEMIGVPFPDDGSVQLRAARRDAVLMGDQIRRAWEDWLVGLTSRGPVVMVLEDLPWAVAPSVRLVGSALKALREKPLFVAGFARPEVTTSFPALLADPRVQHVGLSELSTKASRRLVHSVLGEAVATEVVDRIVAQAAGNAFFLEEILRAHDEGQNADTPATVRVILQRRLEALGPDERRVLRAASVFGVRFSAAGVAALTGEPVERARASLSELERIELVSAASRDAEGDERAFRHAIVRAAAYDMLTDDDRVTGHRLAGEWLEKRGHVDAAVLAEHLAIGGANERAVLHHARAAQQALEGGDLSAVVDFAARAVACGASGPTLGELRRCEAEALRWLGRLGDAGDRAGEAAELLEPGTRAWYTAMAERGTIGVALGKVDQLLAARDAFMDGARAGDGDGRAEALVRVAAQLFAVSKRDEGDELLTAAERLPMPDSDPILRARFETARALRAVYAGDPETYYVHIRAARDAYRVAGDRRSVCLQEGNIGAFAAANGAYDEAEEALQSAIAVAHEMGLARVAAITELNVAVMRYEQDRYDEAIALQRHALEAVAAQDDLRSSEHMRVHLARSLAAAGMFDEALAEARKAVEATRSLPPVQVIALATLADIELERNAPAAALEHATAADVLLQEIGGIEDDESLVRAVHADALHAAGREEEARAVVGRGLERLEKRTRAITPRWRDAFLRVKANRRLLERARAWGVTH